jgi:hypothetical protein
MQSDHQRLNFQTIDNHWKNLLDKRKNYVPNRLEINPTYRNVIKSIWDILGNQKEKKYSKPQNTTNQPHPSPDTTVPTTTTKDIPLFKNIPFHQQPLPLPLPSINTTTTTTTATTTINPNPPIKPNNTTINPTHHHLPPKQTEIHIKEKEPQQQQQQPPSHTERPTIPHQDKPQTHIKQLPFNIINSSINHSSSSSSNHINELGKKRQREMTKEQTSKKSDSKTPLIIDLNNAPDSIQQTPTQHLLQEQINHNTFQV